MVRFCLKADMHYICIGKISVNLDTNILVIVTVVHRL